LTTLHPDSCRESGSSPNGLCGFCSYAHMRHVLRRRPSLRIPAAGRRDRLPSLPAAWQVSQEAVDRQIRARDRPAGSSHPAHNELPAADPIRRPGVRRALPGIGTGRAAVRRAGMSLAPNRRRVTYGCAVHLSLNCNDGRPCQVGGAFLWTSLVPLIRRATRITGGHGLPTITQSAHHGR